MKQMKIIVKYDYSPFWELMKKNDVTQYALLKSGIIDNKTLDGIKKNKNLTLKVIGRLCNFLECTPNDLIKFDYDYEWVELKPKKNKKKKETDSDAK